MCCTAIGWTVPLEVVVNGVLSYRTDFCVGEDIVATCTIPSTSHIWSVTGSLSNVGLNAMLVGPITFGPFHLEVVDNRNSIGIRSSISFRVSPDLDGVLLSCSNDNMNSEVQTLTVGVLGKSSVNYVGICYHVSSIC